MQEGAVVAERLRCIIEKEIIVFEEKEIQTTVSIGVSEITEGITADQLIKKADKALYISKGEGRNRVTCFSTTPRTAPLCEKKGFSDENGELDAQVK